MRESNIHGVMGEPDGGLGRRKGRPIAAHGAPLAPNSLSSFALCIQHISTPPEIFFDFDLCTSVLTSLQGEDDFTVFLS